MGHRYRGKPLAKLLGHNINPASMQHSLPKTLGNRDISELGHVDNWVFDLDNTLYPADTELFKQVSTRITEFVAAALNLEADSAERVRRQYFLAHGSTLRGMMTNHAPIPITILILFTTSTFRRSTAMPGSTTYSPH